MKVNKLLLILVYIPGVHSPTQNLLLPSFDLCFCHAGSSSGRKEDNLSFMSERIFDKTLFACTTAAISRQYSVNLLLDVQKWIGYR